MPAHKVYHLDKKIPVSISLSTRTKVAFFETCNSLGVAPSNIAETLIKDFIKNVNNQKPKK